MKTIRVFVVAVLFMAVWTFASIMVYKFCISRKNDVMSDSVYVMTAPQQKEIRVITDTIKVLENEREKLWENHQKDAARLDVVDSDSLVRFFFGYIEGYHSGSPY